MKPRLLDLYAGAGGAGMGYSWAGFEVVGVDIAPQPRYPFEFHQADALSVLSALLADEGPLQGFSAIHASPPCQKHSKAQRIQGLEHPDLIGPTRELLKATGLPYVIENVPGAPLEEPILLCGTMLGLPLYRHRLFECSFSAQEPLHGEHWLPQVKMGRKPKDDEIHQPVGHFTDVEAGRRALGTPWMTRDEMAEAIPPAYTEFVGRSLMVEVNRRSQVAA